jgi:hypothetical protein
VENSPNPFTSLLTRACDRLFIQPVLLTDRLRRNPADTLHALSCRPEKFGAVVIFPD